MDDPSDVPGQLAPAAPVPSEPACVTRARSIDFGVLVTGYLCHALVDLHLGCLVGFVYAERRGRFEDGAAIRSSTIEGCWEHEGFTLYRTVNGSIYVVCDWLPLAPNSRFTVFKP